MTNDKIREVALRVAGEMCNEQPLEMRYGVNAKFSIDFLTRCLQELSITEQDKLDAEPTLTCPHCKVDRLKEPCPDLSRCKFVATAYSSRAMENGK